MNPDSKHALVGVVGTVSSITLGEWESVAAIVAGFATAAYMITQAVLLWRRRPSRSSHDPRRDN